MSEGNGDTDFLEQLRRRAEEKLAEYYGLKHEQELIQVRLERTKAYLGTLNSFLEAERQQPVVLRESRGGSIVGRPGNRAKGMPVRKSEWEALALREIVGQILAASPNEAIHADTILEQVYEIESPADMKRAKTGLVSTLRRGANEGLWEFVRHNRYKAKATAK